MDFVWVGKAAEKSIDYNKSKDFLRTGLIDMFDPKSNNIECEIVKANSEQKPLFDREIGRRRNGNDYCKNQR